MIGRYGDMKNSRRTKSPQLVRLGRKEDRAVTAAAATDPDNPELTDADFARMGPAVAVVPDLVRLARRARGPQRVRPSNLFRCGWIVTCSRISAVTAGGGNPRTIRRPPKPPGCRQPRRRARLPGRTE